MSGSELWITGVGFVTPLGWTDADVWANARSFVDTAIGVDAASARPAIVHKLPSFPVETEVPRSSDRRLMGPTFQAGAFAAGRALQMAGLHDAPASLASMPLFVACRSYDRDHELDLELVDAVHEGDVSAPMFNRALVERLRPTRVLEQLPNLLASNIGICFGVKGSSTTFVGDEHAGVHAFQAARAHILSGQSDIALAGGSVVASNRFAVFQIGARHELCRDRFASVWSRQGLCPGAGAAFSVIERADHARARAATPLARLESIVCRDDPPDELDSPLANDRDLVEGLNGGVASVYSSACGVVTRTCREYKRWAAHQSNGTIDAVRSLGAITGYLGEATFSVHIGLASISVGRRQLLPPLSTDPLEERAPSGGGVPAVVVSAWGAAHGRALALLRAVE